MSQSVSLEQPIPALADQAGLASVLSKVAKGQNLRLALVAGVQDFFRAKGCRKGCVPAANPARCAPMSLSSGASACSAAVAW